MDNTFKKITIGFIACMAFITTGCAKYSDYTNAYSDHVVNDRARIDKAIGDVNATFSKTITQLAQTPDNVVELTLFDSQGREVPIKIKDTSKSYLIMEATRNANLAIETVSKATPFTLEAPTTLENVAEKAIAQTPFVALGYAVAVGTKNAGTHTSSSGSSTAATGSFNGNDHSSRTELPELPVEEIPTE